MRKIFNIIGLAALFCLTTALVVVFMTFSIKALLTPQDTQSVAVATTAGIILALGISWIWEETH